MGSGIGCTNAIGMLSGISMKRGLQSRDRRERLVGNDEIAYFVIIAD
jgi:hypothetical protein